MPNLNELTNQQLTNLYVTQKLSTYKIAKQYTTQPDRIRDRLQELNIPRRNQVTTRLKDIDPKELRDLYLNQKLSTRTIGEHYGVANLTVSRWIRQLGISPRSEGFQKQNYLGKAPRSPIDNAIIIKMYVDEKISLQAIGKKLGFSPMTIYRILIQNKIPFRKTGVLIGTKYTQLHSERIAEGKIGHTIWYPVFKIDLELGHVVRSSWEQIVFKRLKQLGIKYDYEPQCFPLKINGYKRASWRPDARLQDGRLLEVKGMMTPIFLEKIKAFGKQYPKEQIILVTAKGNLRYIKSSLWFKEIHFIEDYK